MHCVDGSHKVRRILHISPLPTFTCRQRLWKNFHSTFVVAVHFTTQLMEKKTEFSVDVRDGTHND